MEPDFRYIIFTDLDGTLIDFETYSTETTAPLAQQLIAADQPIVFCSSKTLGEQRAIMDSMGIDTPCIVENGSGIYLPNFSKLLPDEPCTEFPDGSRLINLGVSASSIRDSIQDVSSELNLDLKQYSQLSIAEIVSVTGLDEKAAARAQDRNFSETLTARLSDEKWTIVRAAFEAGGLQCLCGGRFHTVTSKGCNKGRAMQITIDAYKNTIGGQWKSIALGDSANDYDMLKTANIPFLVQQPNGNWYDMDLPNLRRVQGIGPEGWVEAVREVLAVA